MSLALYPSRIRSNEVLEGAADCVAEKNTAQNPPAVALPTTMDPRSNLASAVADGIKLSTKANGQAIRKPRKAPTSTRAATRSTTLRGRARSTVNNRKAPIKYGMAAKIVATMSIGRSTTSVSPRPEGGVLTASLARNARNPTAGPSRAGRRKNPHLALSVSFRSQRLLTVELSGALADVWAWHFIYHASAPAKC